MKQLRAHFRSAGTEIGQKKIARARVGLYVQSLEFLFEPPARTQYVLDVELHRSGIADSRFRSSQCGYVDGEGSSGAAKNSERFRAGDDGSKAKSRESRGFEKVRATKSCGY